MAQNFPYTYYSCPCVNTASAVQIDLVSKRSSQPPVSEDEEEEQTFDPRSPRANYSLYPLEYLLYCTECHEIRCPRCITEEVMTWYCPSCLFEAPSTQVKSEGNRCTRNCYTCPICTAPLTVNSLALSSEASQTQEETTQGGGSYILACGYCNWSSLDIGIRFDKYNNITGQLLRVKNGGRVVRSLNERDQALEKRINRHQKESERDTPANPETEDDAEDPDADDLFRRLSTFYKTQLSESEPGLYGTSTDLSFYSPGSISRIMSLYSGGAKTSKQHKPTPMREAHSPDEGLKLLSMDAEGETIQRMRTAGWDATASIEQRSRQARDGLRFLADLRPLAPLLRTKRSKRCRACRQILSRPEAKVQSTRYKINLLALNHVPKISLRPLASSSTTSTSTTTTTTTSSTNHNLSPMGVGWNSGGGGGGYAHLKPLTPAHFLLTLHNPLFDPVRVTLATPSTTPGRIATRVTVLCPQFDVGANTDAWDEAPGTAAAAVASAAGSRRRPAAPSASDASSNVMGSAGAGPQQQAEAGKVWARGRNWTSVVVEVVPGVLPGSGGLSLTQAIEGARPEDGLEDDEDVLEVPVFVRVEYETEGGAGTGTGAGIGEEGRGIGGGKAEKGGAGETSVGERGAGRREVEKREVAFWCVVGVGRIVG